MKKLKLLFILMLSLSCKSSDDVLPKGNVSLQNISAGEIVKHTYYTLSYSEENEQAYWVQYVITPEEINGTESRTDDFRADPAVSTGSASLDDFKGSGYDRGHLCPATDMKLNHTSMSETFYLSNMSSQVAGFNRGIWSKLESQVMKWAISYSKLKVVTGAIFKDDIGVIGTNKVAVPRYYYKVSYDGNGLIVGFILPNASSTKSLDQFVVTVDEIEKETGIYFFPGLNNELENRLEGRISTTGWSFQFPVAICCFQSIDFTGDSISL